MNSGQAIQLCDTIGYEPKAMVYVYGEDEELTQDDEYEVGSPVIYLDFAGARTLAGKLLEVARLVEPAKRRD